MMNYSRKLIAAVVAALLAALVLLLWFTRREPDKAETASPTLSLAVQTLNPSEMPTLETFAGVVRAKLNATLSAKVAARIVAVSVREGDAVRNGQLLVQLDPRESSAGVQAAQGVLGAARAGLESSRIAETMQASATQSRTLEAKARLDSARAGLQGAKAKLDLALAGPRPQEREQAHLAVLSAESQLKLAEADRARSLRLYEQGATSRREWEQADSAYQTAKAAYQAAIQAESVSKEGSRPEEIRAAQEGVRQYEASVRESQAALEEAHALALQTDMQKRAVEASRAQLAQSAANLSSAGVTLSETKIEAPFDGVVTGRLVDPGVVSYLGSPLLTIAGGGMRLEASVPESKMPFVALGTPVQVHLDSLGQSLGGRVIEIVPQADSAAHTFIVRVSLPEGIAIKPGMYGRMDIQTGRKKALWIDEGSVLMRDGLPCAFVVDANGAARLRILTLGLKLPGKVELLSGLAPGEKIVAAPPADLQDGTRVAAKETAR